MSISCTVTSTPIEPASLLDSLVTDCDGAALLFMGVVRNRNEGLPVTHLDYEAYREMAEQTLAAIAAEAREQWQTGEIRVIHRIGRLEVGQTSVAIAVASEHRDAAYSASRYIIEELKRRAPIWKREGYVGGESAWLEGGRPMVAEGPS
jgi:molybdopterin synthase catalytic subunit